MLDLHEGVLTEFAERSGRRYTDPDAYSLGFHLVGGTSEKKKAYDLARKAQIKATDPERFKSMGGSKYYVKRPPRALSMTRNAIRIRARRARGQSAA